MAKPYQRWTAEVICIASIYPGVLPEVRLNHGPSPDRTKGRLTTYRLEPVIKGKKPGYTVIEVADGFEDVLDIFALGGGGEKNPRTAKPVDANETVAVLLQHWTGNMVGVPQGAYPGIMRIIGTVPQKSELEEMWRTQKLYGEFLYAEGSRLYKENKPAEITGAMKVMAEWLGHGEDLWVNPAMANQMGECPECREPMRPDANICAHCRTRIRPMSPELVAMQTAEV